MKMDHGRDTRSVEVQTVCTDYESAEHPKDRVPAPRWEIVPGLPAGRPCGRRHEATQGGRGCSGPPLHVCHSGWFNVRMYSSAC